MLSHDKYYQTHYLDTDEGRAELTYELFSGLSGESWNLFTPQVKQALEMYSPESLTGLCAEFMSR